MARLSDKENGNSVTKAPLGVANRRNLKAQRKEAQKQVKLVQKVPSGAKLEE